MRVAPVEPGAQESRDVFAGRRPLILNRLRLPPAWKVLVLAPHPDDFDAVGITLRLLQFRGHAIYVCVLGSGASGVEDAFCSPPLREIKTRLRQIEQRESCRFFGLPASRLTFLRLAEDATGEVAETLTNLQRLRQHVESTVPDLIILPHGNDTNAGHHRTWAMVRNITAGMGRPWAFLLHEDPKTVALRRDAVTLFSAEEAAWKGRLLRFHSSQQARNMATRGHGFDERILRVNRNAFGEVRSLVGKTEARYAEAFELRLAGDPEPAAPVSPPARRAPPPSKARAAGARRGSRFPAGRRRP